MGFDILLKSAEGLVWKICVRNSYLQNQLSLVQDKKRAGTEIGIFEQNKRTIEQYEIVRIYELYQNDFFN